MIMEGEAKIVPRWEWRTFDASLNAIEVRLATALAQVAPHTSAEIYLLRLGGPQNAKNSQMVFLTSNVCIELMSVVLNCGNRCSRPNSRLVKTMLRQLLSNGSCHFPDLAEKPTLSTNSLMN